MLSEKESEDKMCALKPKQISQNIYPRTHTHTFSAHASSDFEHVKKVGGGEKQGKNKIQKHDMYKEACVF